jgi:hypothetical protein
MGHKRTYLASVDSGPPWVIEATSYGMAVELWQATVATDDEPDQISILTPRAVITEESCTKPGPDLIGFQAGENDDQG